METTRHFVATCFVVESGATALHEHEGLGAWLPPGGHVDRGELPHETAIRETREETGLEPTLVTDHPEVESSVARSVPRPRHLLLEDVNVHDGAVGHQHVDHVYFATVDSRSMAPAPGERGAGAWSWFTPSDLREADLQADVREIGLEAVETVENATTGE